MHKITQLFIEVQKTFRVRFAVLSVLNTLLYCSVMTLMLSCYDFFISQITENESLSLIIFVILTSLIYFIYYFIFKVLRQGTPVMLASELDDKLPEFKNSLICAVEKETQKETEKTFLDTLLIEKVYNKIIDINIKDLLVTGKYKWKYIGIKFIIIIILAIFARDTLVVRKAECNLLERYNLIEKGIVVSPENTKIPIRNDIKINAIVNRWKQHPKIVILDEFDKKRVFHMNNKNRIYSFTIYDVVKPIKYKVMTSVLSSQWFTIDTYDPPKIQNIKFILTPPSYTKLKPKIYNQLKNTSSLVGSDIVVDIVTENENNSAFMCLNDTKKEMNIISNKKFKENFILKDDASLAVLIRNGEYKKYKTPTITIESIQDIPPVITIISPEKDINKKPNTIIDIKIEASDDFGIDNIKCFYSISGQQKQQLNIFKSSSKENIITEHSNTIAFDTKVMKAQVGDIISYFVTIEDNKEPLKQVSRSEISFIEIREDIKPKKMKGKGSKKEINIQLLITELKRIIRLNYDLIYSPAHKQIEITKNIKAGIHDLTVETNKIITEIKKITTDKSILDSFNNVIGFIDKAENNIDKYEFEDAITNEGQALTKLILIQNKLRSNVESESKSQAKEKSKGKGKGKGEGKGKTEQKQDLKKSLEMLAELQNNIQFLADRQGGHNSKLKQINSNIEQNERKKLRNSQKEIKDDTNKLNKSIPENFNNIINAIKEAEHYMKTSEYATLSGKNLNALRNGIKAHTLLLSTAEKVKDLKEQFISKAIQEVADVAEKLSKTQSKLASKSQEKSERESSNKSTESERKAQQETRKSLQNLKDYTERLGSQLEKIYPKASDQLFKSIQEAEKNKLSSNMKRAENALLYKKFERAADIQNKTANKLQQLARNLQKARSMLPEISQEDMLKNLKKLQQSLSEIKNMKKNGILSNNKLKSIQSLMEKRLEQLGKDLNSPQIGQFSAGLNLAKNTLGYEMGLNATENIIAKSAEILKQYIVNNSIKKMLNLRKKTSDAPEGYKQLIEEYFKEITN